MYWFALEGIFNLTNEQTLHRTPRAAAGQYCGLQFEGNGCQIILEYPPHISVSLCYIVENTHFRHCIDRSGDTEGGKMARLFEKGKYIDKENSRLCDIGGDTSSYLTKSTPMYLTL